MGVHGLTTFLRENRRALSTTISLSNGNKSMVTNTTVVVDAWSFLYALYYQSNLPWIFGGEIDKFAAVVIEVVEAWQAIGLHPIFVFDGPSPPVKFDTILSRINDSRVKPSLIFFRTSAAGRASTRFLADPGLRMLPPLVHEACIRVLLRAGVVCHFADSEADGFAVELAGTLGAYVIGLDSDFVILRPGGDGFLGYIPLDEMVWNYPLAPLSEEKFDDDFVPMKGRKRPKGAASIRAGLIPVEGYEGLNLTVYTPDVLASHLHIPVAFLPVLAAFVGCDFSSFQRQFFDRSLTLSQRIVRTAHTLQPLINPASRRTKAPSTVMDLVNSTINALSVRPLDSAEKESMAHTIVEAILQYSIMDVSGELWPTPDCLLHHPSECALLQALNTSSRSVEQKSTLRSYIAAFRSGKLAPECMDVLFSLTYWPTVFLENPDLESNSKFIGRPIRQFMYAVLNHDVGLVNPDLGTPKVHNSLGGDYSGTETSTVSGMSSALEDDLDLSDDDDVTASHSDSVASSFAQLTLSNTLAMTPTNVLTVKEYVRRGGHVGAQEVTVPTLDELLASARIPFDADLPDAVHARPEVVRMTILLMALDSDTELIRGLDEKFIPPVAILRWILKTMAARPNASERWQRQEAEAFLFSCLTSVLPEETAEQVVIPETRNVQLIAQVLAAYEATLHLSQVLFLFDFMGDAIVRFSGQRLHACLVQCGSRRLTGPDEYELFQKCWAACVDGLHDVFAGEMRKSPRKERKQHVTAIGSLGQSKPSARSPVTASKGMFALLADMPE